jgi:hypothetical protein
MKARTLISICMLAGLTAVAQTTPPSQKVAPAATAKPAVKQAAPAKPMATPAKTAATSPMRPKPVTQKPVKNAAAKAPVKQAKAPGKRDPFISPVRQGGGGPDCAVGKKCLAIDSIVLRGIVRAPSGSIAVVESSTRKVTYFLRENDPVFNGYVVKITADTVMFRENVVDRLGTQSTRDIAKRVSAPPV